MNQIQQILSATQNGAAGLGAAKKPAHGHEPINEAARKVATDFESVLLNKVMEEMQATVPDDGLLEDPMSKQVQGMFWFHLSQDVAAKGGAGLWKQVYNELVKHEQLPKDGIDPAAANLPTSAANVVGTLGVDGEP